MIELKGTYTGKSTVKPTSVLVQFDDNLLHVWHLRDPFYRIALSSSFLVSFSSKPDLGYITLSDAGRIETQDVDTLQRLNETVAGRRIKACKLVENATPLIMTAMAVLLIAIWLMV